MKKREISAGAEKVENIARRGSLQGEAANNGASGAEQEREAAERRVQAALTVLLIFTMGVSPCLPALPADSLAGSSPLWTRCSRRATSSSTC